MVSGAPAVWYAGQHSTPAQKTKRNFATSPPKTPASRQLVSIPPSLARSPFGIQSLHALLSIHVQPSSHTSSSLLIPPLPPRRVSTCVSRPPPNNHSHAQGPELHPAVAIAPFARLQGLLRAAKVGPCNSRVGPGCGQDNRQPRHPALHRRRQRDTMDRPGLPQGLLQREYVSAQTDATFSGERS